MGQNVNMLSDDGDVWYPSLCDPVSKGLLLHITNALMWEKYFDISVNTESVAYILCTAAGQEAEYHLDRFPVCHLAHTQSNTINTYIPIGCFT